ncbi:MAG TPA: MFS transporter [Puia sp.]|nr:MFS transporter [Puia sp.]
MPLWPPNSLPPSSVATVALSLSSYFIGISAGQLLYGPLLDRHGRKNPLYAGLVLYILSSASCLVVKDINFVSVLQNRQFLVYALTGSLAFAGLLTYVSGSPMLFMDIYHVDKKVYGWIFAFLSVAFIGLSQFNTLLLKRYTSQQIARVAITGQVLVMAAFLAGSVTGRLGLPQTIFFIFLFLACLGFVNPNMEQQRP